MSGVDSYFWTAFLFPKDTPGAIVQRLADASNQTLNRPRPSEQLQRAGIAPVARELAGRRPISATSWYRDENLGRPSEGEWVTIE